MYLRRENPPREVNLHLPLAGTVTRSTDVGSPRPSNSRIKQLENEVARLQGNGARTPLATPEPALTAMAGMEILQPRGSNNYISPITTPPNLDDYVRTGRDQFRRDRVIVHGHTDTEQNDRQNCFHGPPSAMFDEERLFKESNQSDSTRGEVHVKSHLLAEAARQRMYWTMLPKRKGERYLRNRRPDGDYQPEIWEARLRCR